MAKKQSGESVSAYFRQLFASHPDWLSGTSNQAVKEQWQADHGSEMDKRTQGVMANVKSQERKKQGISRRGRGRRGRKAAAAVGANAAAPARAARPRASVLMSLEDRLDDCLSLARQNPEGFDGVIKHLRNARNAVVYLMGEPG